MSSTSSPRPVSYRSRLVVPRAPGERTVSDTQEAAGLRQAALAAARVWLIGAGGIGSHVGMPLVRLGIGAIDVVDFDTVDLSNLNRQAFFLEDVHQPKALRLACNLAHAGFLGTAVAGYPMDLAQFLEAYRGPMPNVVVAGVDDDRARVEASRWCLSHGRPLVSVGIAQDASGGYVFVQEPGRACLGCFLGGGAGGGRSPCPGGPAVVDVLQVVGGYAVHAVTSLLTPRVRTWNAVRVFVGTGSTTAGMLERRAACALCAKEAARG